MFAYIRGRHSSLRRGTGLGLSSPLGCPMALTAGRSSPLGLRLGARFGCSNLHGPVGAHEVGKEK